MGTTWLTSTGLLTTKRVGPSAFDEGKMVTMAHLFSTLLFLRNGREECPTTNEPYHRRTEQNVYGERGGGAIVVASSSTLAHVTGAALCRKYEKGIRAVIKYVN